MDQAAANFSGLSADIRRVAHTAVINEDNTDSGTILVKRSKARDVHMLLNFTQPDPKQAEIFDNKFQVYYPKIQTLQIYDLGKSRSLVDQYLLLGFGSSSKELATAYAITLSGPETVGSEKTTRIELIPKSQELLSHLTKVDLWISDGTGIAVQQKFEMPGGDYNLATYSNMKINPNLPDSSLKLNLPKGVKREYPQK